MRLNKKIRIVLFLALAFLLLVSAPIFILYSKGYRFDFSNMRPIKTGAFYFKSYQNGIEIYLNGKLENKISPIFKTLFIDNLLPKTYDVLIKKDGFHSWEKNLEVQAELVTEVRNIYLFPILPEKEPVDSRLANAASFYFSQDGKKIAVISKTDSQGKLNIAIYDLPSKNLIGISDSFFALTRLYFSNNSKRILIKAEKVKESPAWFIINIDYEKNLATTEKLSVSGDIDDIRWHNQNSDLFYYISNGFLIKYDLAAKTTSILTKNIHSFAINENDIFLMDNDGFLVKTDFNGRMPEKLSDKPLDQFDQKIFHKIVGFGAAKIGILDANNKFYLFDESKKSFEKIGDSIENVKFFHDDKILYFGKKEVWVMWLSDYLVQPIRKAGDKEIIARFSEEIDEAIFFPKTNEHLILKIGSQIKIAELDNRDKRNIMALMEADGEIFYNRLDDNLYFLKAGNLYRTPL